MDIEKFIEIIKKYFSNVMHDGKWDFKKNYSLFKEKGEYNRFDFFYYKGYSYSGGINNLLR